jgi:Raf kinase inhibitor-like YbhB/YbcL family protein
MMLFPRHIEEDIKTLTISSSAFADYGFIPCKYTSDGDNVNPPLSIKNIPKNAKTMVIIMEDPDAPIRTWVHWLVWNVRLTNLIKENFSPIFGMFGNNDFRKMQYIGPCHPAGIHHYHFKIYALDDLLNLPFGASKMDVEKAMSGHIIAFGELVGLYKNNILESFKK